MTVIRVWVNSGQVVPTKRGDAGYMAKPSVIVSIEKQPDVDTVTGIYPGAAWHERETHEMFGQGFTGFVDGTGLGLRPLLLPDGFEGTPLRKSFVLAARATRPWPGGKELGAHGFSSSAVVSDGGPDGR